MKEAATCRVPRKDVRGSGNQPEIETSLLTAPMCWRQGFERAGFPGIDVEFAEVKRFFAFAEAEAGAEAGADTGAGAGAEGGVVVDMSCGSGLMTRRLATCAYGRHALATPTVPGPP